MCRSDIWGHVNSPITRERDHSTLNIILFATGRQLEPTPYLAPLTRYEASKNLRVMTLTNWTRNIWFPLGGPLEPTFYLTWLLRHYDVSKFSQTYFH